jgi:hypothetical protein
MTHTFPTITRYAATFVNKDGMRTLMTPNQGRCLFDTMEEARKWLDAVIKPGTNSESTLASVYGPPDKRKFAVRPVECYENGDAVGIYFNDQPSLPDELR